jgi:aspartate kinase
MLTHDAGSPHAPLLVQKYGGTSLASPERIRTVARRILRERDRGKSLIVVVSAMGHTTDELVALARQVASVPSRREMDMLLTAGERISMALLSMCLADMGADAISFTGSQSGILTDASHTEARIVDVRGTRILEELARGRVVIVAGFQGVSVTKEVTTLGRGGSDTTAVALAAAFRAAECEILTDVDGVLSADPKLVPTARLRRAVAYDVMVELSDLGAQVLHPRAAEVALRYGVPLHIRSSFHEGSGTMVIDRDAARALEGDEISGIAHERGLALVRVEGPPGTVACVLRALESEGSRPQLLAQTPRVEGGETVGLVVQQNAAESLAVRLRALGGMGIRVVPSLGLVSVVGKSVLADGPLLCRIYAAIERSGAPILLTCTSALSACSVVPEDRAADAVRALHAELLEAPQPDAPSRAHDSLS